MPNRVLLIEDDEATRFGVARYLERRGFRVAEAATCEAARRLFVEFGPKAVVTDFRLPDGDALQLIADFRADDPELPIVVLTGYGSIELAVQAVKTGARNFLTKPVDLDKLVAEINGFDGEGAPLRSGLHPATTAQRPKGVLPFTEEVERLKDVDCSLLILGETGTGKTVLARRLHEAGRRRSGPFIDLNCAGLARDLLESELFGHERGAFTSAHAAKAGMFELADGGTLFLDEIGDIDPAVQPKVLKAIEEKRFRRMGAVRETSVDVRIVAATHRDLREAARTNAFRSDLYYRLSTVTITIPSLRARRAEIPALARELITTLSARIGRAVPDLAPDAEAALVAHSWPGNIRELKNVLERALHLTRADVLLADDLRVDEVAPGEVTIPQSATLREMERTQIEAALAMHGHVGDAARSLGISRSSMYLKVRAYGLLPARGSSPRIKTGSSKGGG